MRPVRPSAAERAGQKQDDDHRDRDLERVGEDRHGANGNDVELLPTPSFDSPRDTLVAAKAQEYQGVTHDEEHGR